MGLKPGIFWERGLSVLKLGQCWSNQMVGYPAYDRLIGFSNLREAEFIWSIV